MTAPVTWFGRELPAFEPPDMGRYLVTEGVFLVMKMTEHAFPAEARLYHRGMLLLCSGRYKKPEQALRALEEEASKELDLWTRICRKAEPASGEGTAA